MAAIKKKKTTAKRKPVKKVAKKAAKKPIKKVAKKPVKKATKKAAPKAIKKLVKKSIKKASAVKAKMTQQVAKATKPAQQASILDIGSAVPDFSLPATLFGTVSTTSLKGKPFVLYFYPKDDTSGCTAEACEFRNTLPIFSNLGVTVIGVSRDNMASHEKFSSKYSLTFPLASDEDGKLCEAFGTWVQKSMYGRSYMGIERSTFLIDSKGIIRAVWRKVNVSGHVEEVRKAVEGL